MKYLIMCEGPNELEIIRMLLEHDKLIFTEDDLLNLVPYHARQIASNPTVKAALNLYHGDVKFLRKCVFIFPQDLKRKCLLDFTQKSRRNY